MGGYAYFATTGSAKAFNSGEKVILQNLNKLFRILFRAAVFYMQAKGWHSAFPAQQTKENTTTMKATITLLSAMALAASLSFGQDKPAEHPKRPGGPGGEGKRPSPEEIFKKLDTTADGNLTLEEFKAGPRAQKDPAKAEEIFKKIDTDNSGGISLEEFKAHKPPHHGGPGKGGPEGDPGPPPPGPPPAAK